MSRILTAIMVLAIFFFSCNVNTGPDNQPGVIDNNIIDNDAADDSVDYAVEDAAILEQLRAVDYNSSGNLANFTALRCDAPESAEVGKSINIYAEVENNGTVTSSAVCYVYLSDNHIISTIDTYLGTINLGSLAKGAFGSKTTSLTIPASTMFGTYFIGFIVDRDNAVTETKEYDNILDPALLPTIIIGKPNIWISSVTAPTTTAADYYLTFTITNNGNLTAGSFKIQLFYSNTFDTNYLIDIIDFTGEYSNNVYPYGIRPGQTVSLTYYCEHEYNINSSGRQYSLSPGTYPLVIKLDTSNLLNETNELDNIYIGQITLE